MSGRLWAALAMAAFLSGCLPGGAARRGEADAPATPTHIRPVVFSDPIHPKALGGPIALRGARNETVSFAVELPGLQRLKSRELAIRLTPLGQSDVASIPLSGCAAYQVVSLPTDARRAGFVRHTGLAVTTARIPRALVPLAADGGRFALPREAWTDDTPMLIWVDVHIPPTIAPGVFEGKIELADGKRAVESLPIKLAVDDFVLPDERHLLMVGSLDWTALQRLFPAQFKGLSPQLISRTDPQHGPAVQLLDQMMLVAQAHRLQLVVPRLQPVVKWPSGQPPQVDWADFDSVVGPWLNGDAFADLTPLGYWPLPVADSLSHYDERSRLEYWANAAAHFEQREWINRSSVAVDDRLVERVRLRDSIALSEKAAELLAVHPRIRVTVPLLEEQVHLAGEDHPRRIPVDALPRLLYTAQGLVSAAPLQRLPAGMGSRWMRTDLPGPLPYAGVGADEREVRLWAWLAYLRRAELIQWPAALPSSPDPGTPAPVDELAWFYPGSWFGVQGVVPSIQLKWLRRAELDYEYLWLARQRAQSEQAATLARLITKPIEIQPGQATDGQFSLLSGTSDPKAWGDALELLARAISIVQPGQSPDPDEQRRLQYQLTNWAQAHQRPVLMARSTQWGRGIPSSDGSRWADLRLGVDIYNAGEAQPEKSRLHWTSVPEAWQAAVPPVEIPTLGTYAIGRFELVTRVNLARITPSNQPPVRISFTDGFTGRAYSTQVVLPVGAAGRRTGRPPTIDGSLEDWQHEDLLHDGSLVAMLSHPAVQRQEIQLSRHRASLYSSWTSANLYLSFRLEGADSPITNAGSSFVNYELRRAWGEDLCEVLIQPVYADNTAGPLLHLACKPLGQIEISRRLDPKLNAQPWQAFAGSDIRYAGSLDKTIWRGELMIPWEAINDPQHAGQRPIMLRFNVSQHRGSTGESFSWAGPVDFGRDDDFTGLIEMRDEQAASDARR